MQVYIGDCQGHLRNIIINGMTLKATECLQLELEDDLAEFSSYERMSVDGMQLIIGTYKEFHPGGAYAKGKQREWEEPVSRGFRKSGFSLCHAFCCCYQLIRAPLALTALCVCGLVPGGGA